MSEDMDVGRVAAAGHELRIRLDSLKPFASEPNRSLTFSDLQAVFGTDLHTTQKVIRVLCDAQLVSRVSPGRGHKPAYLLEKALVQLLLGRGPQSLMQPKALECAAQALDAVSAHNAESTLARVTGVEFSGSLLDPSASTLDFVDVRLTVAVKRSGHLVRDVRALLHRLRLVGNGALRESLVLVVN